jgi:hypothetical protein
MSGDGRLFDKYDTLFDIFLEHPNLDDLVVGRLDLLADIVGLDRKLAVAAINENRELNVFRAHNGSLIAENSRHDITRKNALQTRIHSLY